mmetsp:Transcript_5983/g.17889  ORF Transcript_5983/g.17889 Transcript_5983/m.17889 type:complete len:192 (-) Transcript_5983:381-956(-)
MWFRRKRSDSTSSTTAGAQPQHASHHSQQQQQQQQQQLLRKLSPTASSVSQAQAWEDAESNDLTRNRKKINKFLKRMGRNAKQDLSLDGRGACNITFKKFLIRVEVPADDPFMVHIHTLVFEVLNARHSRNLHNIESIQIPKGISVAMDGYEVNLAYSTPISKLNYKQMLNCMEAFMQTALDVNTALEGRR